MITCESCLIRKQYAKCFDVHFDWRDCLYACNYASEMAKMGKLDGGETIKLLDNLKSAIVDRLSEEAKRIAEIAIHSKGQAADYYTGMKTGMARAAILANNTPIANAEWILKLGMGMIPDAAERNEDSSHPFADSVMMGRIDEQRRHESIEGDREV